MSMQLSTRLRDSAWLSSLLALCFPKGCIVINFRAYQEGIISPPFNVTGIFGLKLERYYKQLSKRKSNLSYECAITKVFNSSRLSIVYDKPTHALGKIYFIWGSCISSKPADQPYPLSPSPCRKIT